MDFEEIKEELEKVGMEVISGGSDREGFVKVVDNNGNTAYLPENYSIFNNIVLVLGEPVGRVVPGKVYKHFKGNRYRVIAVAEHTETGEQLVVYQAIETGKVWVRPYDMWVSKVDRVKYPKVEQEYRFEEE